MTGEAGQKTLHAMNTKSTPAEPSSSIDDLFHLVLVDGLPVESGGKTLRYRTVRLRETGVADEREAQRASERVVLIGGVHKLVVSDADFRYCLTTRHIESFGCDGMSIPQVMIDMELVGKLSSHDFGLIEQRVFLITMAAEVRYGNLSQEDFDQIMAGNAPKAVTSPQRAGQAQELGSLAAQSESGPALLADLTGKPAGSAPASHGE